MAVALAPILQKISWETKKHFEDLISIILKVFEQ